LSSVPKKGSKYSDEAMFFIGQTYEQKGDNESAISAYKILVEEKNAFSTKASKRIKILEGR
jgi:TolA-binding protein